MTVGSGWVPTCIFIKILENNRHHWLNITCRVFVSFNIASDAEMEIMYMLKLMIIHQMGEWSGIGKCVWIRLGSWIQCSIQRVIIMVQQLRSYTATIFVESHTFLTPSKMNKDITTTELCVSVSFVGQQRYIF